jgi:hypothetical protein
MLVDVDHAFDAIYLRVEDVSVEGEAVVGCVGVRRDRSTKAEDGNLLVAIVVLQDISHWGDGFQILVLLHVEVVKGAGLRRFTIGESEVNGNSQADIATSKDILKEGVTLLHLQFTEDHHMVSSKRPQLLVGDWILFRVFLDLAESQWGLAAILVFTRLLRNEELDADFTLNVVTG